MIQSYKELLFFGGKIKIKNKTDLYLVKCFESYLYAKRGLGLEEKSITSCPH